MSRFLTISHVEGGPTLVHAQGDPEPELFEFLGVWQMIWAARAELMAEFRDGMDAMRFLTAVANSVNNPEARADYLERRELYASQITLDDRWFVYERSGENLIIATFAERADADLFVNFMRIG